MNARYERGLAEYLQKVLKGLEQDKDTVRAIRRLQIKKIHLLRKGKTKQARMVEDMRGLI